MEPPYLTDETSWKMFGLSDKEVWEFVRQISRPLSVQERAKRLGLRLIKGGKDDG